MHPENRKKFFGWFDGGEAAKIGVELADRLLPQQAIPCDARDDEQRRQSLVEDLQMTLLEAEPQVSGLRLNFFKKAKLANSFRWRLLEKGVDGSLAAEITQGLVLHLSAGRPGPSHTRGKEDDAPDQSLSKPKSTKQLLTRANQCSASGALSEAIGLYEELLAISPRDAVALNNLGAALSRSGRYEEAEECFRLATEAKPDYSDAYGNLGTVLRWRGFFSDSEAALRRAVKLNPKNADARVNLGMCLALVNRIRDAKGHFTKVLKTGPRNADALFGMALVEKSEGHFEASTLMLNRALEARPDMPSAWALLASMRRMTVADAAWLHKAEQMASSGKLPPIEEAELRFAIGKYNDDVSRFDEAFESYQRANALLKTIADPYDRGARSKFVDDSINLHKHAVTAAQGAHPSDVPVFVVGMPRSGTSLVEQIIASHPDAKGAGEVEFWSEKMNREGSGTREGGLGSAMGRSVADEYLRILQSRAGDAARVVDKAPVNCDYLGVICSIFPNARIIYMLRDPLDTCLSCYFQNFPVSLNFTLDLADLAHYYREHHRLMNHWRRVLPPNRLLDVSYAGLVADPEGWIRKVVKFLDLPWNERCLEFQATDRAVVTASSWQVRQKMYGTSVERWRNYERFLGPLRKLKDIG